MFSLIITNIQKELFLLFRFKNICKSISVYYTTMLLKNQFLIIYFTSILVYCILILHTDLFKI